MDVKVSPYPIRELREFLRPFRAFFSRYESAQTLERVATGLVGEIDRKSGARLAARPSDIFSG